MRLLIIITIVCSLIAPSSIAAEDVFDRLKVEPVTMLDFGLKRLRFSAQQAARKLAQPSDSTPQTRVVFDPDKREIQIQFFINTQPEHLTEAICLQKRQIALKETFQLGGTAYIVPISDTQRIARGLGRLFTHEPAETPMTVKAMGERLAQSTYLKVSLAGPQNTNPIVCGGFLNNAR